MKTSKILDVSRTANNFKQIRINNNITTENLSYILNGVSIDLINKIEQGEFIPTLEYIFDFCEYFNVSIDNVIVSVL